MEPQDKPRNTIYGTRAVGLVIAAGLAAWEDELSQPEARSDPMSYGTSITLDAPFAQSVARVREALKEQGFGVLTEIDMTAVMREKLGQEIEDYLVLGACNPPLAYRALGVDRSIGLLLPCNVVVRAVDGGTVVEALDPQVMVTLTAEPQIAPIAEEAARRLRQALDTLAP